MTSEHDKKSNLSYMKSSSVSKTKLIHSCSMKATPAEKKGRKLATVIKKATNEETEL